MDECTFKLPTVSQQDLVAWSDCTRNRRKTRQTDMLLLSRASARKAKRHLIVKVGSHSSFFTFTNSGIPTQCVNLIWLTFQTCVWKVRRHSTMRFFTLEIFEQNALQEWSDAIKRSCMKDHQKSHRTIRQSKRIPSHGGDRVLDQDQQPKRFDLVKRCVHVVWRSPNKDELTKGLFFSIKKKVRR